MATKFWTSLSDGQTIAFNPATDVLQVNDSTVSAASIYVDLLSWGNSGNLSLSYFALDPALDKTVTLQATNPRSLTPTNVTFSDGSMLLIGDKALGTANDNLGNTLTGGLGDDQLLGLGGADSLSGGDGGDKIEGGMGNDTIVGGAGDDILFDTEFTFDATFQIIGGGNDSLVGGAGVDFFIDFTGNNTLNGGDGGDLFFASALAGGSRATGGLGQDFYFLSSLSPSTYYESLDFDVGAGGDFLHIGTLLSTSATNGSYQGGDPFVQGYIRFLASGADTLVQFDDDGPGGFLPYSTRITLKNITPASVSKTENVTGFVTGSNGNDSLIGGTGDQAIFAAAGADTLNGGAGTDSMHGGLGRDLYYVDDRNDSVFEASNASALAATGSPSDPNPALSDIIDTVIAAVTYSLQQVQYVENLTLTSAATSGTGNDLANVLTGNSLRNGLFGLGGNDTFNGGAGVDTLRGGTGNDTYTVGAGDVVSELSGQGTDLVKSSVSHVLRINVENLTLTGAAGTNGTGNTLANTITGNGAGNTLTGNAGGDTLRGLAGADVLRGGTGKDTLTGGVGADKFDFNTALSAITNVDRIVDFSVVSDTIRLDNDIFKAFAAVNVTLAASAFNKGANMTTAQDGTDHIVYNTANGNLYYDADGAGNTAAVLFATLAGLPLITNADFFIVG